MLVGLPVLLLIHLYAVIAQLMSDCPQQSWPQISPPAMAATSPRRFQIKRESQPGATASAQYRHPVDPEWEENHCHQCRSNSNEGRNEQYPYAGTSSRNTHVVGDSCELSIRWGESADIS